MKKTNTLITISCFLVISAVHAQQSNGYWTGVGKQVDGKKWVIELEFYYQNININYPGLGCYGEWILEQDKEDESIYRENIKGGTDKCDQGAEVHVQRLSKKRLKVTYYLRTYDATNPIAKGILKRKKKK